MGGTCWQDFALGVNQYLVLNNTSNYCWSISSQPHWTLVYGGHPLADGVPDSYNFTNSSAAYYWIRVNDPEIEPVAINGDSYYNFFLKNSDFPAAEEGVTATGDFIWFINSAYSYYWSGQADFDVFKQIVNNGVTFAGGGDAPWLSEDPTSGVIPGSGSMALGQSGQVKSIAVLMPVIPPWKLCGSE